MELVARTAAGHRSMRLSVCKPALGLLGLEIRILDLFLFNGVGQRLAA